jgi:hypothetical protein
MDATWQCTVEGSLMNSSEGNPLLIGLFFVLRCLVPLAVMLGLSYLLRRLKLIQDPPKPPAGWDNGNQDSSHNPGEGGMAHGKA